MNKDPKLLMEEGWKARENHEFTKAKKQLKEALEIFEINEDWFNVTEALNHLAYTEKVKAVKHILKGIKLAKKSEKIAKKHNVKKALVLRALMSIYSMAGLFEQALIAGEECLELNDKPLPRADVLSHIATFQMRTGNLDVALNSINEAEQIFNKHLSETEEPHRSIWLSRILATKGLILFNTKDKTNAKKYISQALDVAQKQNLKTRVEEIKALQNLF